jgi:hypothetical protein
MKYPVGHRRTAPVLLRGPRFGYDVICKGQARSWPNTSRREQGVHGGRWVKDRCVCHRDAECFSPANGRVTLSRCGFVDDAGVQHTALHLVVGVVVRRCGDVVCLQANDPPAVE